MTPTIRKEQKAKKTPRKREGEQEKTTRMVEILRRLRSEYTGTFLGLNHSSAFQLLIATILSAQCTDERVNMVTPALFTTYPRPEDFASAPLEEIEQAIHSTGFYKAKARNIKACCTVLVEEFNSTVPDTLEELITLAGVGRKTANVVLSQWFGKPGLTVDTHVTRLSNLLGFVATKDAVKIEQELMDFTPQKLWNEVNTSLITHGRAVCIARRPQCNVCCISDLCPSAEA
ncbi:MAG: endonuclease III [Candidatus Kapabacteria bacterium]|nr:endonuclease III [Candidatus Kapabacteria bacterium]